MLIKVNLESICMIWGILLVAEKKKILYMVEAMGGGVFTYIVDKGIDGTLAIKCEDGIEE